MTLSSCRGGQSVHEIGRFFVFLIRVEVPQKQKGLWICWFFAKVLGVSSMVNIHGISVAFRLRRASDPWMQTPRIIQ